MVPSDVVVRCSSGGSIWLPILTFCVVAFGAIIAYQQWRVARERLRQDYFQQCFQIYYLFHRLIQSVSGIPGGDTAALLKEAETARAEARFLFEASMTPYLDSLFEDAHRISIAPEIYNAEGMYSPETRNRERGEAAAKHMREKIQFAFRIEGLIGAFEPYLRADEWVLKRPTNWLSRPRRKSSRSPSPKD